MGPKCQKCIASCAVHALKCEADVIKGREAIDCKTFKPQKSEGEEEREKQEILTFMRGVRRNLKAFDEVKFVTAPGRQGMSTTNLKISSKVDPSLKVKL